MKLGVNVDHVATLRQARYKGIDSFHAEPDPVSAALICLNAGADSIVMHLREDRRHIQDKDIRDLRKAIAGRRFNLEMSIAPGIVSEALRLRPDEATLVPEKRKELTTEGGLDVVKFFSKVRKVVDVLQRKNIIASLFIDPDKKQIRAAHLSGARFIELHTGKFADAKTISARSKQLKDLRAATSFALSLGLKVNAGHGLNYENVRDIVEIEGIEELNIGHSIISRAVSVGLKQAVREMKRLIR